MRKQVLTIQGLKVAYTRTDNSANKFIGRFLHRSQQTELILKNINLSVYEDEILGLVGESGCGKSLTVKSIFGMINFFPGIISGQINYFTSAGEKISLLDYLDDSNNQNNAGYFGTTDYKELIHSNNAENRISSKPTKRWKYNDRMEYEAIDSMKNIDGELYFDIFKREHPYSGNLSEIIQKTYRQKKAQGQVLAGKEISIILQDPLTFLNPHWSIKTQIENLFNLFSYGRKKSKIKGFDNIARWQSTKKILKDLRINTTEFLTKIPRELSGGQAQRVMIVLSRMSDPELLIADEPTTGLDVTLKKRVVDFFRERKKSMIFISHDLNMVRMVADRINVMYNGEIVENCISAHFMPGFLHHPFTEKLVSVFYTDYAEYIEQELPSKTQMKHYNGCAYALQGCPHVKEICKDISPPAIDTDSKSFISDQVTERQWVKCWKFLDE